MISENILLRKKHLLKGVEYVLKGYEYSIKENESDINIQFGKDIVITVAVKENYYCIHNISDEWAKETTYLCEKDEDETIFYRLDNIDECLGEISRIAELETKKIAQPIINDGTLLSVFRSIEDQYPELEFSKFNAKNEEEKRAVYIYPKNVSRKGNVIFEIWNKPRVGKYDLYIKKEFLTNEEHQESKKNYDKTSDSRGRITRVFNTDQDLLDFVIPRLNMTKNKK